jgi:hypothetical protein
MVVVVLVVEINKEKWLFLGSSERGRTSINRWRKTLEIYSDPFLSYLTSDKTTS